MFSCCKINDNGSTECMILNECDTCAELKEKTDQIFNEYMNATNSDNITQLYQQYTDLSDCYKLSCE